MKTTMNEAKTLRELSFAVGVYRGHGVWANWQGAQGTHLTECRIVAEVSGTVTHIISRVFVKNDGSLHSEEDWRVRFTPSAGSFFEVSTHHAGIEYRGHGYSFGQRSHYDIALASGVRLEATYLLNEAGLQLLGSTNYRGDLTVWAETLKR